jgi:TolA-binding protein
MKKKLASFLLLNTFLFSLQPLQAESNAVVKRRIKALEQKLSELKQQDLEENDSSLEDLPGYTPPKQQAISTANLLSRLTNLEESVRTITGKMEENSHQLTQLRHQLEVLIGDIEVRFKENETAIKTLMDYSTAKDKNILASDPNPSGTLSLPAKQKANPPSKISPEKISSKDKIKQQYLEAKAYYDAGNIQEAAMAFENFVENNPKNEYSASASLWLGKSYLKLNQPKKAAVAFKKGYTQYAESRRTAENLLGMAEALSKTNPKNACVALEALRQELPNRELMDKEQITMVQTKVNQLHRQLKCGN